MELATRGTVIFVSERNGHPEYSKRWSIDLYTGRKDVLESFGTGAEVAEKASS